MKHEKKYRLTIRKDSINLIKEESVNRSKNYIEQKIDKQDPEPGRLKYCDSSELYLKNYIDYNRHVETLNPKNNVRMIDGEIIKSGDRYDCITCKITKSNLYL